MLYFSQESPHTRADVRDAMGVSRGLHGAAGYAAHAAGPPARERIRHHRDCAQRTPVVPRHPHIEGASGI